MPVVPFAPLNFRSLLTFVKFSKSIRRSANQRHALFPTVVSWAGLKYDQNSLPIKLIYKLTFLHISLFSVIYFLVSLCSCFYLLSFLILSTPLYSIISLSLYTSLFTTLESTIIVLGCLSILEKDSTQDMFIPATPFI